MIYVIEGLQWGDEGKGKITDYFAQKMDIVVRHQGGNNAGHSVNIKDKKYALKSLPSGILSPNITNIIANGVVLNPKSLIEEIELLKTQGITNFNLFISNRCHIIMPYHIDLDGAYEAKLKDSKIGTTKKGIGPCYMDKMARIGLRYGDLLESEYLKTRLKNALEIKNIELASLDLKTYEFEPLYKELLKYAQILKDHIIDTSLFLQEKIDEGKNILFEGAQGGMLCIDHGTYPYVTSSSPLASSVSLNAGISPKSINHVIGIMKAYTTRVGEGPFVTELNNDLGSYIREKGHEYGVVTKRPRRVGYLDLVVTTHTAKLSGCDAIALTLLDVLTGLEEIKVCTAYKLNDKEIKYIPSTIEETNKCKPIYSTLRGWKQDISKCKTYDELPKEAKEYVEFIENYMHIKVILVSVGPERDETLIKEKII